ncbi:MAG: AMP-binding protein [Desulfonatronovibrio sp.]
MIGEPSDLVGYEYYDYNDTIPQIGFLYNAEITVLEVSIQPPEARSADGNWRKVGETEWLPHEARKFIDSEGTHEIEFRDVSGWSETGSFMISPLPISLLKPGSATKPLPGIEADILDEDGNPVEPGKGGYLVIKNPWPSMLRTLYKDPERYKKTYWEKFPGYYLAGDVARKDEDGYFWIQGRSDDVLNIAGHRVGTAELESALVSHKAVAEAAVIGIPDKIKHEVAKAFVTLNDDVEVEDTDQLIKALKTHVRTELGPVAVVKSIEFRDKLPKTRSGKIMRRVLKAKELGEEVGDTSTLED